MGVVLFFGDVLVRRGSLFFSTSWGEGSFSDVLGWYGVGCQHFLHEIQFSSCKSTLPNKIMHVLGALFGHALGGALFFDGLSGVSKIWARPGGGGGGGSTIMSMNQKWRIRNSGAMCPQILENTYDRIYQKMSKSSENS